MWVDEGQNTWLWSVSFQYSCTSGTFPQDDFPEDVSTDEDDDTFSRRKWKRKSGKSLDKTKLEKEG